MAKEELVQKKCLPCTEGAPPLGLEEKLELTKQLHSGWELTEDKLKLSREIQCKDFAQAMDLTQNLGKIAQEQWHHPEITLGFGYLKIFIWTHKINNLVEADFILAAKFDQLLPN